ncbi:GNAT family N-acetyltransferase [Paenibacillus sp. N1-5-1-14]|uniref:GNAT family N-acetyltransferase n=1 Tax=Paenibacillus radicibacter TaxID=2972488 RepID=UPI0021593E8E|nr:GNAT family N-acetyltransferase [Paenibacillus radicibacter]MCR8644333.1 GNAT family N-acetyltransferase [Paenibacillus radicibacter]
MRNFFLTTARLGFSNWEEADLDLAYSLWGEPLVTKYISSTGIFTSEQIQARLQLEIDNQAKHQVQYWPIFEKESFAHVGCCGFRPYNLDEGIYAIGFHLKSTYWGVGYAREAAEAVIAYAPRTLQAKQLFAGHNPNNQASRNLLEKLGFVYWHDEFYEPTGLYHPSYLLNLIK